jgi:hypothetical protein
LRPRQVVLLLLRPERFFFKFFFILILKKYAGSGTALNKNQQKIMRAATFFVSSAWTF